MISAKGDKSTNLLRERSISLKAVNPDMFGSFVKKLRDAYKCKIKFGFTIVGNSEIDRCVISIVSYSVLYIEESFGSMLVMCPFINS